MAKKTKKADKAAPSPRGRRGGPPAPLREQRPFEQALDTKQPPRVENVKPERPRPGRFHPGRGDIGGRG